MKKPIVVNRSPPKLWSNCPTCKEFEQQDEKISRLVTALKRLDKYAQEKTFQDSPSNSINYISSTRIKQVIESVKDIL